jgi:hypothetical protein
VHSSRAIQLSFIESDDYLNHSLKLRKAEYNQSVYGLHCLLAAWLTGLRHPDCRTMIGALAFSIRIRSTFIPQYHYTKRKSADSFLHDKFDKCCSVKCMANPKEPSTIYSTKTQHHSATCLSRYVLNTQILAYQLFRYTAKDNRYLGCPGSCAVQGHDRQSNSLPRVILSC